MKTNFTKLFIIVLLMCISLIYKANAQTTSPIWVNIDTVSNVIVSYQISICQGEDKLYLKIENNNSSSVTVKWSFWGATNYKSIQLNANETKTGDCNINSAVELDELIPSGKTIADLVSNIIVY